MKRIVIAAAALIAWCSAALAQPVTVIGPITPGDCTMFSSTTVLKDGGIPCPGSGGTLNLPNGTTATTQPLNDNTTKVSTDQFVQNQLAALNLHLVVYTVAPSGASAADKARADFVGNGVGDQIAVNAAVTAAGAGFSKVVMLPGTYNFSGTANISGSTGFIFEARGTIVNGPGVGGAATATDTFLIQNSNFAEYNFGAIKTNNTGTAAAIHSTGGYSETKLTWQQLDGTSRSGYGYFGDSTTAGTSQSVNWITATHVQNFAKGIALIAAGSGANIDTYRVTADFIYNNVVGIFVSGNNSGSGQVNASVWNVNIDCHHTNGDIGFETNGFYEVINATLGPLATLDSGTCTNIQLDSGATDEILNLTPQNIAVGSGSVVNNSGATNHVVNVGMPISLLTSIPSQQLTKWSATPGQLLATGLTLGTIGAINTLSYFSAVGVWSSLPTANSSVLVTSGGGVPSWATTLPSGLTIPSPTFSGTVAGTGTIPSSVLNPTLPVVCFIISTSAVTCNNGGSAANNGTYTTPVGAKYLRVRQVGAGAGGAGGGTTAGTGTAGGNTTFGSSLLTTNGGAIQAGAGGTASGGYANLSGGSGGAGDASGTSGIGGPGGISGCGFSSSSFGVLNGVPTAPGGFGNGGAGGGSNTSTTPGAGGSAGGCLDALITAPSATYPYAVGAAGPNGAAGTNGQAGASGTSGAIEVIAYFQ